MLMNSSPGISSAHIRVRLPSVLPAAIGRSLANRVAVILITGVLGLACLSAGAQQLPTRLKIIRDKTLSNNLLYWFVAPSLSPSARLPLPQAGPDNAVSIDVPAAYYQPGAQVKILDTRKGLLAHLPIRDTTGRIMGQVLGPNLLQNPDFMRDGEHWLPELTGGQAKGEIEWLGATDVPKGVQGKAVRVKVLATDSVSWHVQFHQPGLDLLDNEPYTLSFWARADRARPVSVNATVDNDDYHWIGLSNQVALTTEWRKVTLIFTATRTIQNHNRLGFIFGDALGTVDLAGLALQRGAYSGPLGANLLQNSNFSRGMQGWNSSVAPPAKATTKVPADIPVPLDVQGKAAQVNVTEPGTQNWHAQFFQTGIDMTEGEPLTLSFWAKSDRSRSMNVIAGEDKEDFHTVGLDNFARLDTTWRKYVLVFTATRTVRKSHRLTFLVGDNNGEVDLANVLLQPGAESVLEPGRGIEIPLSQDDFKYSQLVRVPVKYMGKQVQDLSVILKYRDEGTASYVIQPADRGAAHFTDIPIDEKITVLVSAGTQAAEFPRIVASDAPSTVGDIVVPENWTQIRTNPDSSAVLPFIGSWESQAGTGSQNYVTTFNADGTGTIKSRKDATVSGAPVTTPASGAFLWHVTADAHHIVMGSREYTWTVSGKGKDERLVLKDAKGKTHTFSRR